MSEKKFKYRATCWRDCYWLETLWKIGEVYEGDQKPNKWFNIEGDDPEEYKELADIPPDSASSDPRPTVDLKKILKDKYDFKVPVSWKRKKIWIKLKDMEVAESKDEQTNPTTETVMADEHRAPCGFRAKTGTGLSAHERVCSKCQEIKNGDTG